MAAEASDPALKESFNKQALAYRKLAAERAERMGLPRPPRPDTTQQAEGPITVMRQLRDEPPASR